MEPAHSKQPEESPSTGTSSDGPGSDEPGTNEPGTDEPGTDDAPEIAAWKGDLSSTFHLLRRARDGEDEALDELFARYLPKLNAWAHGRLPRAARDLCDTHDLVQDAFLRTLRRVQYFEPRHQGSFQAFLRVAVKNRIRDLMRQYARRPTLADTLGNMAHPGASPLEQYVLQEKLDRYEAALEALEPEEQSVIFARLELGMSFAELAEASGKPSPDAARMAFNRALKKLVGIMQDRRGRSEDRVPGGGR